MSYLFFPLLLIAVFSFLIGVVYPKPGRINEAFAAYKRPPSLKRTIALWFAVMAVVFFFVQWLRFPFFEYAWARITTPSSYTGSWPDAIHTVGIILVMVSELIVIVHWVVYLYQCWVGSTRYHLPPILPLALPAPPVVVFVPACDEEADVLRRSLSTMGKLRYPNLRIFLVENSRKPEAKAAALKLAREYGVAVLDLPNRGHKAGALNDALAKLDPQPEFLAVIDADQAVVPEFLEDIVPLLQNDSKVAFVQTPQLYDNAEDTWTCRAAAQQEALLYDTILEAKGANGRALCCGSNFVMRVQALAEVGGWDERSVSEDLMTGFLIHAHGWKSLYMRKTYAIGLGPVALPAYWKQQRRWATGNTTVAFLVARAMLHRSPRISLGLGIDYFWSAAYYITTLALAILATLPMLLLLAVRWGVGAGLVHAHPALKPLEWVYLSVYPMYAAIMLFPYLHMHLRGYPVRCLIMLQGLLAVTVPVYLSSVFKAIARRITFFEVGPKSSQTTAMPMWKTPQTYVFLALVVAGSFLVEAVLSRAVSAVAWIAMFWTLFYTISFGHYFIFTFENRRLLKKQVREKSGKWKAES
jgi:cellulose synthase (UDP-forming)